MTPTSHTTPRATAPINGGWLVFGNLLADSFGPAPGPENLPPKETRAFHRGGLLHRLRGWWTRPVAVAPGSNATDAATRLEILERGGFPR